MPVINIYMSEGKSEKQKSDAVEGITKVVSKSFGVDSGHVVIHMIEIPKNNISVGGVNLSEFLL